MYSWIFNHVLFGPSWWRIVMFLLGLVIVFLLLVEFLFPLVQSVLLYVSGSVFQY